MESLEGKRGVPRIKPPFPAVVGLYGGPRSSTTRRPSPPCRTCLRWAARPYAAVGTPRNGGTRLFCISGHVERPGVYELPMGYNLQEDDLRGCRRHPRRHAVEGRRPRRIVRAGAAAPKRSTLAWTSIRWEGRDHARLRRRGGPRRPDLHRRVRAAHHQFYQHESCGWCIPCREGTDWLERR